MNTALLDILKCPSCNGKLSLRKAVEGTLLNVRFGILQCSECTTDFPVVEEIAIIRDPASRISIYDETGDGSVLFPGPRVAELVRILDEGKPLDAFAALLSPLSYNGTPRPNLDKYPTIPTSKAESQEPQGGSPTRKRRKARFGGIKHRIKRGLMKYVLPKTRVTLARFLYQKGGSLSTEDLIDLYYKVYSGSEMANYFKYRFGQPRHLAALTLASLLSKEEGPILDLACGVGHITHYLAACRHDQPTVGVDRDFFRMYIASKSVAPSADFICCDADGPLPFASNAFHGSICSDAFHYFPNQWGCVRELKRVVNDDGPIILARVGNIKCTPNEGREHSLEGYKNLFEKTRVVELGEDELRTQYLEQSGPNLVRKDSRKDLESQKWLSFVASNNENLFASQPKRESWPHAIGRLNINPIYVRQPSNSEDVVIFKFEFPSEWYEFEDAAYTEYAPPLVEMEASVMEDIAHQRRTEKVEELIRRFVVVGMPENYLSKPAQST